MANMVSVNHVVLAVRNDSLDGGQKVAKEDKELNNFTREQNETTWYGNAEKSY